MSLARFRAGLGSEIQKHIAGVASLRFGRVVSYDGTKHLAKVVLLPEGATDPTTAATGWIPVLSLGIGNGWGIQSGLQIGDQVAMLGQEHDPESHTILGACFSTVQQAPGAQAGETWLQHSSGSYFRLLNNGSIESSGPWRHTGSFSATGNFAVGAGATGSFTTPTGVTVTVRDGVVTNIF